MYADAVTVLENLGLSVVAPHTLLGKSGQHQPFDIVTTVRGRWGGSKTIAIDVLSSEAGVFPEAVRDFSAKVRDAKPSEGYLIAVPGLTEDARLLAKNLKLNFVEGASLKEATTALLSRGAFKDLGT